jgi:hypothetical protein
MRAFHRSFNCLLVVAVAANLTIAPVVAKPATDCSMKMARAATLRKCSCGDACHCLACPCMTSRQQPQCPSPAIPTDERNSVTLHTSACAIAIERLTAVRAVEFAPVLLPAPFCISTLFLKHTCMQV